MLIAAVLAAGRSARMGTNKLLLPLGDRPILRHVVEAAAGVNPDELLVIAAEPQKAAVAGALAGTPARILVNARAAEGIGTSIACAAASLPPGTSKLVLLQGDQPLVSTSALERLIDRAQSQGRAWVAARYGHLVTTPVVFDAALFAELRTLDGDRGAKRVLDRHRDAGKEVDLPEWMGLDVDDPEGYRRVQELWPAPDA
jgi:molybdenum cofactor cytidylyltransferase